MGHVSGMVAKLPAGGVSPSTPPIPVLAIPLGERDQGNREAGQKHLTPMVQASCRRRMESSWETGLQAPGLRSTRQTGRHACWWNPQALRSSYPEFSQRVIRC